MRVSEEFVVNKIVFNLDWASRLLDDALFMNIPVTREANPEGFNAILDSKASIKEASKLIDEIRQGLKERSIYPPYQEQS